MVAPSASIIRELLPRLSASLGQIRRVPGRGDAWVSHVLGALEREHDPRFQRMQRRIGFAERLAEMAGLEEREVACATLGLFFHELLPAHPNGARSARPWREYFLRNEEWLRPALEICEFIDADDWLNSEDPSQLVAKVAAVYDSQTLDHNERTLQVVEQIVAAAEGAIAQRIVDLLWTEDGQELCDHHFRRHPRGYRLEAATIQRCIGLLYRYTPRLSANVTVQSLRLSGSQRQEAHQAETEEVEEPVAPAEQSSAFENFDKRRQALRTRRNDHAPLDDISNRYEDVQIDEEPMETQIEQDQRYIEQQRRARELTPEQEERLNQITAVAPPAPTRDALDVREKLQELRISLGQIQKIAAQAEDLLAGVAPQIDDFAARIADVEAVMQRWTGRRSAAA